jgi:hypothetical protein
MYGRIEQLFPQNYYKIFILDRFQPHAISGVKKTGTTTAGLKQSNYSCKYPIANILKFLTLGETSYAKSLL